MEKKPDMGWDSTIEEAHIIPEKDSMGEKVVYDFAHYFRSSEFLLTHTN